MMARAADRREYAFRPIEIAGVPADEMDQLASIRLRTRADHGRIEEGGSGLLDLFGELSHPAGRQRTAFDRNRTRAEPSQSAMLFVAPDRARGFVVAHHCDDDPGALGSFARGLVGNRAGSR